MADGPDISSDGGDRRGTCNSQSPIANIRSASDHDIHPSLSDVRARINLSGECPKSTAQRGIASSAKIESVCQATDQTLANRRHFNEGREKTFPLVAHDAQIIMSKVEHDFWTDEVWPRFAAAYGTNG
jgi:hypothetical protein